MSEDMDTKGIYFDLQWKTKSGSSNVEEFGSIGIWEVDDSSLDWFTFKPYLCQTLGKLENVSISYVDSDGDEIPIDSDLEFQEALKYARRKAAMHQKIVLKVEKLNDQSAATGGVELLNNPIYLKSSNFFKERLKINCNNEGQDLLHVSSGDVPVKVVNPACKVKTKPKSKDTLCPLQSCDTPPLWFKKYMKKMKSEIISEVTANVNSQMKKLLEDIRQKAQPVIFPTGSMNSNGSQVMHGKSSAWLITKTKKKISDGESSDGAPKIDIRDSKILRKIEKLDRRERKLDHKKEKLEQKTKKIAERKEREYLSKLRLEIAGCKTSHVVTRAYKEVKDPEVASSPRPLLNEVTRNQSPPKDLKNAPVGVTVNTDDMRMMVVKRGSNFTKVWKVTNSGGKQWTDETEVKLSWGNEGLTPEVSSVKCPHLAPGEEGEIAINFSSPLFPGVFESHWHFYHQNVRFGGRMSCIVSVDLIKREEEPNCDPWTQSVLSPSSSSKFVLVHPTSVGKDGSYGNIGNEDLKKDSAIIVEGAPSGSTKSDEPLEKSDPFSIARGPWLKEEKLLNEDKYSCTEEKEAELDSISSDDLSGNEQSLGSDSDDNFVIVPMPPCFRIDVPLNSGGQSAIETDSEETGDCVGELGKPSVSKAPESPPMHLPSAPLETCHTSVGNAQTPDYFLLSDILLQREVSHDTGEVTSVPLMPPQPKPSASTTQFQPAVTPLLPKYQPLEPRVVIRSKPNQSPPCSPAASQRAPTSADPSSVSDHSTSSSSSAKSSASSRPSESSRSGGKDRGAEKSADIPQPKTSPRPSPRPNPSSSRPIDLKPRSVSEVINGAISVTSSAINTAFAALDSILENPMGTSVTPGTVYRESPNSQPQRPRESREDPPPPPIDPVMASDLTKLANMGFIDLELNQALLRVYNHNLPQVIEALLNGRP